MRIQTLPRLFVRGWSQVALEEEALRSIQDAIAEYLAAVDAS